VETWDLDVSERGTRRPGYRRSPCSKVVCALREEVVSAEAPKVAVSKVSHAPTGVDSTRLPTDKDLV
jgi:hypothetical protein